MQPQIPQQAKEFSLKKSELSMLSAIQQVNQNQINLFMSFIANERLAQTITENTRMIVQDDKLFIWEEVPQEQIAPDQPGPAVATPDTSTSAALKKGKQ